MNTSGIPKIYCPAIIIIVLGLLLIGGVSATEFGPWSIQTVASTGNVGQYSSITLNAAGNPRISYYDQTNGDLKYASWDGSRWAITTVDSAGNVGMYSSLALGSSGNPRISYYDQTNEDLKYASWDGSRWAITTVDGTNYKKGQNGGNWDGDHGRYEDKSITVGMYSSLALDSSGNPRISYYDQTNEDLKYASWDGSRWAISTADSVKDVGEYSSLELDTYSNPRISYFDATNGNLKFAAWNRTTSQWVTETVDSSKRVGEYTSLALDSLGNPRISYYDQQNQNLKYAAGTGHVQNPTAPAPTFTSITPATGPAAGGTTVTIIGTNFVTGATTVTIGGNAATSVAVSSSTTLTATTPSGTAGSATVVVTTAGGSVTGTGAYMYIAAPAVTGVSPTSGPLSGGSTVTITGSNLANATAIKFGTTPATILTDTAGSITVTPPTGTTGNVDITVTTPGGTSAISSADQYTYTAAPTFGTISPVSGPLAGGQTVSITGTNFVTGATTVTIGGNAATSVAVSSSTTLTATTPSGTAGSANVAVTTAGGSATGTGVYTYKAPAPTFTSITPATGPAAGGTAVTIVGTNFVSGGSSGVTIGGAAATNVVVVDSAHITAITPAGTAGSQNVVITNNDGQTITAAGAYTYVPAPTVTGITPAIGVATTTVTITSLSGMNFMATPLPTVWIAKTGQSNITATNVVVVSPTQITCMLPLPNPTVLGPWDVVVQNADGQSATLSGAFTVTNPPPTVTGITPTGGTAGTLVSVTDLAGTNFVYGSIPTVWLAKAGQSNVMATGVTVQTSTQISCTFPLPPPTATSAGPWDVVVQNTDGQSGTLSAGFTVTNPPPTVTGITPTGGTAGTLVSVTSLAGTNFVMGTTPAVWLAKTGQSNITVTSVTVVSPTQITCTLLLPPPTATSAGPWDVVVQNADGQSGTLTNGFAVVYGAPTVTGITPSSGTAGTSVSVTSLAGTNFVMGTTPAVWLAKTGQSNITVTSVTVVSPTQISCTFQLPPPSATSIGPWDVVVKNADGQSGTLSGGFNVVYDLSPPLTVNWSDPNSNWNGWDTSATCSGAYSQCLESGPFIISTPSGSTYGSHGSNVSGIPGQSPFVTLSGVSKTFTAPYGTGYDNISFSGMLNNTASSSSQNAQIWVNGAQVNSGSPGNNVPFVYTGSFTRASTVTVLIQTGQSNIKGSSSSLLYMMQFYNLTLSQGNIV